MNGRVHLLVPRAGGIREQARPRHGTTSGHGPVGPTMTAVIVQPQRLGGRRWIRGAALLALVTACLAGGVLAVDMLSGNNPLVRSASGPAGPVEHVIGEDVATSFGVVAVEHATAISGLDDSQITGAHGVPGLVEAGSINVQVAAVITNLSDNVLTYDPTQFELIDNTGASVAISRAAQLPGELQPFAAIDVLIDFVTTTDVRPFTFDSSIRAPTRQC